MATNEQYIVTINGTPKFVGKDKKDLSYSEVARLANMMSGMEELFTITYRNGHRINLLVFWLQENRLKLKIT